VKNGEREQWSIAATPQPNHPALVPGTGFALKVSR
jgi:hypothetical protein